MIKMVETTEIQEINNYVKVKLRFLKSIETKIRELLLKQDNEQAIKILKHIIEEYKNIGVTERAKILDSIYQKLLIEFHMNLMNSDDPNIRNHTNSKQLQKIMGILERKIRRRIRQGKVGEAIDDLKYIISELREANYHEEADLLDLTVNQYLTELLDTPKLYEIISTQN